MKRLLVLLTLSVLFAGSIFAFGPMNQQNQTQTAPQTPAQVSTLPQNQMQRQTQQIEQMEKMRDERYGLFFNLPADASISEVKALDGSVTSISIESEKGIVVKFESAGVTYNLKVGPIMREISLKAGDKVTVTGRIVSTSTDKYIVVEKVKIGDKEYTVTRDKAENTQNTQNKQNNQNSQNTTKTKNSK
ncbi:MAG TPA: hypothetical protein PKI14_13815 [Fervidobacterium sp.]|nr:hypothetical protein [Fervidobacterium sp.]HPT54134.1 hypothetical protein [Fervidobacterium sp.]HPZ17378.1 hypothetical protein [Fervidobacterium sp.]HQE48477.1 hypothetical protein [Fervidobacterium sp.]HUM44017.1 hypothetical protein [Fervidobacterium sp.]